MKTTHIFATVVAILIVSMSGHTYAESRKTDASVSGHVIDAKTGEHLPYVTVMIGGTQIGIQTSSSGHYSIRNLPLGKHEIIATSIGENPAVYDIDKRWSLFSGGMIPGGADHHPVKRQILPLKAEIGLVRLTGLELKSDRSVFIAN